MIKIIRHLAVLVVMFSIGNNSFGQVIHSFTQRASIYTPTELIYNIQGDFAMIGNTNLTLVSYNDNTNNSYNVMQYVDVDGDATTFNSSTATLEFSTENGANPVCSNIIYAGLYWTGRASNTSSSPEEFDVTIGATTKTFNKRKVKLKGPGAAGYTDLEANPGNIYYPDGEHGHMYSAYIEVTDYVQDHGIGAYTVADMALVEGNGGATGYYGGWGMIVVYENSLMNWRDVTIFDGHAYVQGNEIVSYELPVSGFQAVQSGNVNMKMGLMAGEGDVGISGDYFQIRNWQDNAWITLSHAGNTTNNFFNSSVETGGNARTLNLQNNTGVDIAMFDVPNPGNTVLTNGQTSTKFRYGSTQDTYVIFCIAMAIDAYIPDVEALVSTESINGVPVGGGPIVVQPGEVIQYSVQIKNQGTEPIDNAVFVVPIPYTTTYVPASINTQVNFAPLPSPNTAYFDPGNGPTGAVVWDFGTLPLPPVGNPDSVLAELTFELLVTEDCFTLMNPDCPPQVVLTGGNTTGVGQISGSTFDLPFIQGYETAGPCIGEPITEPLILDIDAAQHITDNCGSEPISRDFIFCDYEDASIPYDSIANYFPAGLKFYNTNSVTPGSTEYTEENPFPATPGIETYFAIPDGIPHCYYTFTITVQAPIETTAISTSNVTCPGFSDGAINLTVFGGTAPLTYNWSGPGAFTASIEDISSLIEGVYNVTVTDSLGCTADNSATIITIPDVIPPSILCATDLIASTVSGTCTYTHLSTSLNPSASDNCTLNSVTYSLSGATSGTGTSLNGVVFNSGVTTVLWIADDDSGNDNTCSFTVTVNDNEDPTITCPTDVTVSNDAGLCESASVSLGTPTTGDNCAVATVTNDAPASYPVGTTTVTWTVTDIHGNSATCTQDVTVNDNEDPTITCPIDVTVSNDAGNCSASGVSLGTPTTADNCGVATVTNDAPATFPVGTTTVTWTVTDIHGNSATCTQDVTVNDNEDPTISCPTDVTVNNDPGNCSTDLVNITLGTPTTADNCGIATVTNDAPATFPVGTTTVTWTVTDIHGNSATCTQDVTVNDNEDPVVTCPADVTVDSDAGLCEATSVTLGTPTTADNCGVATVTNDAPATYPVGTTTVTWTITDIHGNSITCAQDVTVNDNEDPTITCPADVSVSNDPGNCSATGVSLGTPTTSDNCGVATVTNDAPATFPVGTTTVTWTVTDIHGNSATCTQDVIVNDDENPSITCPLDVTVNNEPGNCSTDLVNISLGNPITADNCGVATVTNDAPATFPVGTTTVTWTVTDIHGNSATCTQDVTVNDNEDPTIACPSDVTIDNDPGTCESASVTLGTPTTADNCGVATVTNDAPATFLVGTTTVTWTVTDIHGNSATCTQDVTVNDTENPTITCPIDVTVDNDPGNCSATGVALGTPITNDNCGVATVTNDAPSTFPVGTTTVTWIITDIHGNSVTCTQDITVNDTENPTITCPTDVTVNNDPGNCSTDLVNISLGNPITGDNCAVATVTNDAPATFSVGTTTVTWTVTDIHGNSATCTQDVTVNDNEDPTLTCPSDQFDAVNATCSYTILDYTTLAVYSDNCGATISQDPPAGTIMTVGDTTITLTVTDGAGNSIQCSFELTVADTTAPVFNSCPGDVIINNDPGNCSAVATWVVPSANENCGLVITSDYNSGDVFTVGTTLVTYVATDPSGNTDTCQFNVIVTDNEAPVLTYCQADTSSCDSVIVYNLPTATDNCGVASIIQTAGLGSGATFPVGTTVEEYEITDINGNVSVCTFTVTVHPLPTATGVVTNVSCFAAADGSIDLTPANGTSPYTFDWSNGQIAEDISGLDTGAYGLTILDFNLCQFDTTFLITQPDTIMVDFTYENVSCFDSTDAYINIFGWRNNSVQLQLEQWKNRANIDTLTAARVKQQMQTDVHISYLLTSPL
ncbi:MAG: HYR domain-containing protein [Crocinitomicaceae bacterium]